MTASIPQRYPLSLCVFVVRKMQQQKFLRCLFPVLIVVLVLMAYTPHTFVFNEGKVPYLWKGCLHNLTAWLHSHRYSHVLADGAYLTSAFEVPGIGNMMFQYASLFGIAHKTHKSPVVPRNLELRKYFDLSALCTTESRPGLTWGKLVEHKSSSFDDRIATIESPVNLELIGYFQSWKYFDDVEDRLRQEFTFSDLVLSEAMSFMNNSVQPIVSQQTSSGGGGRETREVVLIGVHVRKGDMASQRNEDIGYTTADPAYMTRAMNYYESKYSDIVYVVCSDNITWCKQHVRSQRHPVVYSEFHSPQVDLAILSSCNHTIVTVGTYGWWAGWLAGGEVTYYKDFPRANSRLERMFSQTREDYFQPKWIGL